MNKKSKLAPRNPLVAASLFRKAGVHEKTNKAKRAEQKRQLRKSLEGNSGRGFSFEIDKRAPLYGATA